MPQDKLIELITKELIGELTIEEEIELKSLLNDTLLKQRYDFLRLYLSNNYDDHSSDQAMFDKVQQKLSLKQTVDNASVPVRLRLPHWKLAAAAIIILASVAVFLLRVTESPIQRTAFTRRATKTSIVLSDGTKVTLNAESKLLYPVHFTSKNREVTLIGEGFFDVVKNSSHPFIIHTSKMNIKVLGTAFNVKAYPSDRFSETSLIRGLIEVTLNDRPADRIILKPSEKLIVRNRNVKSNMKTLAVSNEPLTQVTHIQKSDTTIIETSWMDNKVVFNEQSFADIAKMLERTYDVKIDFRSDALEALKFTGSFKTDSIAYILQTLSLIEPFAYKINDKTISIEPIKPNRL